MNNRALHRRQTPHVFYRCFQREMITCCSYCAFGNGVEVFEWKGKLENFRTMFQAELMGLKEAIIRASQGNVINKIWNDRLSSVKLDYHTTHQLARDIQSLLTQN
ncbi:hypothetical protein AVEN_263047-1 [Araneus ventricosus]|uniref:RNase H type-1 domain-containing protein n=1 Tax=Araneus ventricosus TaxID=182803 RepID=A0A4Y2WJC4_ARAVE|nr:hypothetical protein AVEN_263047-1 [Araneus ventricosus]